MNLEKIINVSGWTGLYKIISQGNNIVIIESIEDGKRSPLKNHNQANILDEISIYTYEETIPLSEVFKKIAEKEDYKQTINHKTNNKELIKYFREILNEFDEDRVYTSNIKKVLQWYNILHKAGMIKRDNNNNNNNNNNEI